MQVKFLGSVRWSPSKKDLKHASKRAVGLNNAPNVISRILVSILAKRFVICFKAIVMRQSGLRDFARSPEIALLKSHAMALKKS